MATLRRELEAELDLRVEGQSAAREAKELQYAAKRAIDIVAALTLLVLLAPLCLIVSIAVKIESRGPVYLRQWRVGKNGRLFRVCKFRTMCEDADTMLAELRGQNEQQGPLFKMRRDPRMTRIGRWLRKTSIDEIPQLWNVLRGDMSLVGPRPPLPREVQEYTEHELGRLGAKPGMTGVWQISGRSTLTFDAMVEMDLEYIESWSLARDFRILVMTPVAVISTRGAY